jgi:hypothetical protein
MLGYYHIENRILLQHVGWTNVEGVIALFHFLKNISSKWGGGETYIFPIKNYL